MISFVTYNSIREGLAPLKEDLRDVAAVLTEDKWDINFFSTLEAFNSYIAQKPLVDMGCYDITSKGAVDNLIEFRRNYQDTILVIIANPETPPTEYLRPGVKADSLVLRPYNPETVRSTLKELVRSYLSRLDGIVDDDKSYVIEDREGRTVIPYRDIYYIESKEKKIFIRTLNEEFGFYGTLDEMETKLPEDFQRCHRSFIVNKKKIQAVFLSKNLIELLDELIVPVSRSYKPLLKGFKVTSYQNLFSIWSGRE